MATDIQMQNVQAALANLDGRMVQVVNDVTEARREVKEAKDSLDEGGKYLQRDLGSNIAKFKYDAENEFQRQQKELNDLTATSSILFANNTQAINDIQASNKQDLSDIAAKTEATFVRNNNILEELQEKCVTAVKRLDEFESIKSLDKIQSGRNSS